MWNLEADLIYLLREDQILWFKNQNLGDKFDALRLCDQIRIQTRADGAAETLRPCINSDSWALYWVIGGWKASLCREDRIRAGGRPVWTSCQSLSSCRLQSCTFLLQVHSEIDNCLCGCWNHEGALSVFFFPHTLLWARQLIWARTHSVSRRC